jgi:DNA-binding transcriptional LysR family regulator
MLHGMNVSAFDLNHLRALHHLLEEAHVARAAHKLGITPAAASNALRRLRADFDDPLLVRAGRSLRRTARAEELRAPAREVMAAAERLLGVRTPFDPRTYDGELVLATSDRIAELLLPALDALLLERAPRATLVLQALPGDVASFLRDRGGIAVAPDAARAPGVLSERLFVDDFVCVLREGHPLLAGPWTARRFAAAEHLLVAPRGQSHRGLVDDLLEEKGLARRVTRVITSFGLAAPLLACSDRVAILPRSFAAARARELPLVLRRPPIALPPIEMSAAWHVAHDADARHTWLRGLLREAARRAARRDKLSGAAGQCGRRSR